jgi:hypothetical protein
MPERPGDLADHDVIGRLAREVHEVSTDDH